MLSLSYVDANTGVTGVFIGQIVLGINSSVVISASMTTASTAKSLGDTFGSFKTSNRYLEKFRTKHNISHHGQMNKQAVFYLKGVPR